MTEKEFEERFSIMLLDIKSLGINIFKIRNEGDCINFYLEAPEYCNFNEKKMTGKELLKEVKKYINDFMMELCKNEDNEDLRKAMGETEEEYYSEVSDYYKVYGKVIKGKIWTQEDYDNFVKNITFKVTEFNSFNEV